MKEMHSEIIYIDIDRIIPNTYQPRKYFDEEALNELAQSIKQFGIIQPLTIRKIGDRLIKPDPTWIRIDDINKKIIYSKGWESYNSGDLYGNSHHQTNILNENVTFYFYGSKLRIINSINNNRNKNIELTIDGNTYYYSEYSD